MPGTLLLDLAGPLDVFTTAHALLIAGTQDPISPYGGGRVTLFGFGNRGLALSARATAETFVRRNNLSGSHLAATLPHQRASDPTAVERLVGPHRGRPVVALYTVRGGGHVVPQPTFRFPRLMGRTTGDLDAPAEAATFFGLR